MSISRPSNGLLRFLIVLLTIIALVTILVFGRDLLIPLATAGLLAMVLNPLLNRLMEWGIPKGLSIAICMLVFLSFFGLVAFLISIQVNYMVADWPKIEAGALRRMDSLQSWINGSLGVPPDQQSQALRNAMNDLGARSTALLGSLTEKVGKFFLIVIYTALFLAERARIEKLVIKYSPPEKRRNANQVMESTIQLAGKYLIGQLKIMGILSVLYGLGFWIGKVPYAIFLAVLAAIFAIIPFLGNIIGGGIAALLALVLSGPGAALAVVGVILGVQLLSDYVLQPLIVGGSIDLSPLATIFAIIAFTVLWGPMGAILALPITASLQTLFKQIPSLKPLAAFMGSTEQKERGRPLKRSSRVKREIKEESGEDLPQNDPEITGTKNTNGKTKSENPKTTDPDKGKKSPAENRRAKES